MSDTKATSALAPRPGVVGRSHRTVEETVTAMIRNAIVAGLLRPGERLRQDRLADMLDVSRMPIRSALRQLESEGLVTLHPHRGATVRALSSDEISDLFEMRIMIERFALHKTVSTAGPEDLKMLAELADHLEGSTGDHDWIERRTEFYRSLYSIGNTPRVVSTILQFRAEVSSYVSGFRPVMTHTHRRLLELIEAGDGQAAADWLEIHIRAIAARLQAELTEVDRAAGA
jgi:DNA-binding GntR family transcriptional regulator